jgi:dTDP-glucose pyrophosphorylase
MKDTQPINELWRRHLVNERESIAFCLNRFNELAANAVVFIVNDQDQLKGSLTDGDIRRGLLKGLNMGDPLSDFVQNNPKFIIDGAVDIQQLRTWRSLNFMIIPVIDDAHRIIHVVNFKKLKSYVPCRALIMAGGKGERLKPLTLSTPKPLLKVGEIPIIEHNIRRLHSYGVRHFYISVHYLADQIIDFVSQLEIDAEFEFIHEEAPLGTIGAMSLIRGKFKESLFILNADVLHDVNFEDYFVHSIEENAEIAVLGLPYKVNIPYAVLESEHLKINKLSEKPTYTYLVNGGIYWCTNEFVFALEKNQKCDATDWLEGHIQEGRNVVMYPFFGYWKDIGRIEDFVQVQEDIKHIHQ